MMKTPLSAESEQYAQELAENYIFPVDPDGSSKLSTLMLSIDGAYAHFVITFNQRNSCYSQWSALIRWEVNTSRRIDQSKRVNMHLLQGKGGGLVQVTEPVYLKASAASSNIKYSLLRAQGDTHTHFLDMQKNKSLRKVELTSQVNNNNQKRYAGLNSQGESKKPKKNTGQFFPTLAN